MHLGNFKTFFKSIKHFQTVKAHSEILMMNITDIGEVVYERAGTNQAGPKLQRYINENVRSFIKLLGCLGLKPWTIDIRRTSAYISSIKKIIKVLEKKWKYSDRKLNYDETGIYPDKQSTLGYLWRSNKSYPVYPYGKVALPGIPGWHIECATLIALNFDKNKPFFHYGGVDLKEIHHHNERCILESLGHKDISWQYTQPVIIRPGPGDLDSALKMSKSLKNGCSLEDYSPYVLKTHFIKYYNDLSWTKKNEFCAERFRIQLEKNTSKPLNLKKRCYRSVLRLVRSRERLRSNGHFKESDHIRANNLKGYTLKDESKSKKTLVYLTRQDPKTSLPVTGL